MTALIRYEQARTALAEAHRVDEVKDIRDALTLLDLGLPAAAAPGCYVMSNDIGVLYVGESVNVKRRLAGHQWRRLIRDGALIRYVPCLNHKQVERWLIAELTPFMNGKSAERRDIENKVAREIAESGLLVEERMDRAWSELFGEDFAAAFGRLR